MAKTISELTTEATIIRTEADAGDNTASRVGTMFQDIIDYLGTLNTSSDSEDEGGSGGGGGGVSLNEPLSSINNMARTPGSENKILVYQNGVWTYGDYGGGSTPTSGVTWGALGASTTEQIHLSHLTGALNSCSFWGQNPVNGVVAGNMINVGSIKMKNDNNDEFLIDVDDSGNLRFNGNIYATGGVSALGNNGSGGGGGGGSIVSWIQHVDSGTKIATVTIDGTTTEVYAPTSGGSGGATSLGVLSDVTLNSPSNRQYLKYNGSKWINSSFSPLITGLNAIAGNYTGLYLLQATNGVWSLTEYTQPSSGTTVFVVGTGNAVINAEVSNNILTLTKGTVLTSIPVASANTLGGIKVGSNLAISNGILSVNGNGLSVTNATNATNAARLSGDDSYSAWGQVYWKNGVPKSLNGNLTGVADIYMNYKDSTATDIPPHAIEMSNGSTLRIKASTGTATYQGTAIATVLLNQNNQLSFGYGARLNNFQTDIQGGSMITFATSAIEGVGDSRLNVGQFTKAGQFYVIQGTEGIRIGDGVIKWDSTHNALYVEKTGGGVANFYALGGVSALGFSGGSTGSVTVDDLTCESLVADEITAPDDTWYVNINKFYHNGEMEASNVSASKFYISPNPFTPSGTNCILYAKKVNNVNRLYFYNGSSEIQIA